MRPFVLELNMKKVIVIGCPGSGKSCFSRKLAEQSGLPLHHLDLLFWNSDKTTVSREEFDRRLSGLLKTECWIIDGNFSRTMEIRLKECDTVFFLDLPADICLESVRRRRGKLRADLPWVETEEEPEFMEYIKTFRTERRPKIIELLSRYPEKQVIIFKSREEVDKYFYTS